MNFTHFFQSKTFRGFLYGVGVVVLVLLIFQAGMFVGYRKAAFSYRHGDSYYRAFDGPQRKPFMGMPRGGFPNAHGAAGQIISIALPTFVLAGPDGVEKVVLLKDDTVIRQFRETLASSSLRVNDFVVVIGTPNDEAQIEARLIRFLPPPPDAVFGTSTQP